MSQSSSCSASCPGMGQCSGSFSPLWCSAVEVGAELVPAHGWCPRPYVGCERAHLGLSPARGTRICIALLGGCPAPVLAIPGVMEESDPSEQHCRCALCHFPCPALLKLLGVGVHPAVSWRFQLSRLAALLLPGFYMPKWWLWQPEETLGGAPSSLHWCPAATHLGAGKILVALSNDLMLPFWGDTSACEWH